MRSLFILTCFYLFSISPVCGQEYRNKSQDSLSDILKRHPHDFSYQHRWAYFQLNDTILAKIIVHVPAQVSCGVMAAASLSIVQTEHGDSIRVLDLCNVSREYKPGQIIRVAPAPRIPFSYAPFTLIEHPQTQQFEPVGFDLTVLKTTCGKIFSK